jgi:hypothetical protein
VKEITTVRWTPARRAAAIVAVAAATLTGSAGMAAAHASTVPSYGPLQQSTGLLSAQQQTEQSKTGTWALESTVAEPGGELIGSPISAYGQTPSGSFGCFLFVCNTTPQNK